MFQRVWWLCMAALAVGVGLEGRVFAEAPSSERTHEIVDEFRLKDASGVERSFAELTDGKRGVVLAFLGTECPVARLYGPRLAELAKGNDQIAVIGINPNYQDDLTKIAAFQRDLGLPFPMLRDQDAKIADRLGVTRTPEVVFLDGERRVRYRGRIDDQYGIGVRKASAKARPLEEAIEAVLEGEEVAVARTEPVGCLIGRKPAPKAGAEVTYAKQISRFMNARCVECHREGQIGPFALTSYEDVAAWAETLRETINEGRMPPWFADPAHGDFRNDASLSADEKRLFEAWVDAGCPEGDPSELPEPPSFAEGWRIEEPDLVVAMRERAFSVPAEGTVDYQYFRVDPKFTEDKYLVAAEPRPGDYGVVHHIIVYVLRPGEKRFNAAEAAIGYAPGLPPLRLPEGQAMLIPAGSQFVFEMHYTPNGKASEDLSKVGLVFTEKERVKELVRSHAAANTKFEIPPGEKAHTVIAKDVLDEDRRLTNLTPHMHFRGAAFTYEAIYPDGTREVLLNVPRYDFNWQLRYDLTEPKLLPKGTQIVCTAVFDNSESNPANPDPTAVVRWGEQSWEEMMIGFYATVPVEKP